MNHVTHPFSSTDIGSFHGKLTNPATSRNIDMQKQPPRGFPRKRCSENIQQTYRRTPMPKCDFDKVASQLY